MSSGILLSMFHAQPKRGWDGVFFFHFAAHGTSMLFCISSVVCWLWGEPQEIAGSAVLPSFVTHSPLPLFLHAENYEIYKKVKGMDAEEVMRMIFNRHPAECFPLHAQGLLKGLKQNFVLFREEADERTWESLQSTRSEIFPFGGMQQHSSNTSQVGPHPFHRPSPAGGNDEQEKAQGVDDSTRVTGGGGQWPSTPGSPALNPGQRPWHQDIPDVLVTHFRSPAPHPSEPFFQTQRAHSRDSRDVRRTGAATPPRNPPVRGDHSPPLLFTSPSIVDPFRRASPSRGSSTVACASTEGQDRGLQEDADLDDGDEDGSMESVEEQDEGSSERAGGGGGGAAEGGRDSLTRVFTESREDIASLMRTVCSRSNPGSRRPSAGPSPQPGLGHSGSTPLLDPAEAGTGQCCTTTEEGGEVGGGVPTQDVEAGSLDLSGIAVRLDSESHHRVRTQEGSDGVEAEADSTHLLGPEESSVGSLLQLIPSTTQPKKRSSSSVSSPSPSPSPSNTSNSTGTSMSREAVVAAGVFPGPEGVITRQPADMSKNRNHIRGRRPVDASKQMASASPRGQSPVAPSTLAQRGQSADRPNKQHSQHIHHHEQQQQHQQRQQRRQQRQQPAEQAGEPQQEPQDQREVPVAAPLRPRNRRGSIRAMSDRHSSFSGSLPSSSSSPHTPVATRPSKSKRIPVADAPPALQMAARKGMSVHTPSQSNLRERLIQSDSAPSTPDTDLSDANFTPIAASYSCKEPKRR